MADIHVNGLILILKKNYWNSMLFPNDLLSVGNLSQAKGNSLNL
jgi:hypothetical protein